MRKFIIISLLSALTLPAKACGWGDTHNYYLFSPYNSTEFKARVEEVCNNNWQAYLGTHEEYYFFDADEVSKAARKKGDALMLSYIANLKKYLKCVHIEQQKLTSWDYPSKQEIAQCKADLQTVRAYALGKASSRLRSQHALLYMRCNMILGQHQENINYWQNTASKLIETVYKDMMKNIYAGALYKTGQEQLAGEMFAEMGDYESLMTQFYKKRSFAAIRQHYMANPTSKVLPFLLTDFVNNAQEAVDAEKEQLGGKLFIRDITRQESRQMQQFCSQVVAEGKTDVPAMWLTAKAWLAFLAGDGKSAAKDIEKAMTLNGTQRMKDNARAIRLYITAADARPGQNFDNYLAGELTWLKEKAAESDFFTHVEDRLTHQVLIHHYADAPLQLTALLKIAGCFQYDIIIDTMKVSNLEQYLSYTHTPAKTDLDAYLKARVNEDEITLRELIGTKYMRLCQWDNAIKWLEAIPASFYNQNAGYTFYAAQRKYTVEPWITRQWLKTYYDEDESKTIALRQNPRLAFAKEMREMESSLSLLSGQALQQRYYDLAVRYAQANFRGDCWWLMHNAKSVYDTLRCNETDLAAKAVELLQKAAKTSDPTLRLKSLFALGYGELYPGKTWRQEVWDDEATDFVMRYDTQSMQFEAYKALHDITGDAPKDSYIARCDEYALFRKYLHQRQP